MENWRKNILFTLIFLMLFFPMIQQKTGLISVPALMGDQNLAQLPKFSLKGWTDGSFQKAYDQNLENRIGFRPSLVRLKNQVEYTLFKKANASGVVVGKKGYLFEEDYIRAYTGGDYLGEWFWSQKFHRFAMVRDTLNSLGIKLALVLEPGKASYYPEYIPENKLKDGIGDTNYKAILKHSTTQSIPLLDLNKLFIDRKEASDFPYFPKGGIHWAYSAMLEAADTLLRFADELTDMEIPDMQIHQGLITDSVKYTDNDLLDLMNLIVSPSHPKMHYPKITFEELSDSLKPRVLTISDSFFFNILNAGIPKKAFANEAFWYYSRAIYPETWNAPLNIDMIDIRKEIESMDIIFIMLTERFFYKFAWNFIEILYESYYPDHLRDVPYYYQTQIITDYNWFDLVVEDANRRQISISKAMKDHAAYQIWKHEQEGILTKDAGYYAMKMRNDSVWTSKLDAKAKLNGISLEEQIELDARWLEIQEAKN